MLFLTGKKETQSDEMKLITRKMCWFKVQRVITELKSTEEIQRLLTSIILNFIKIQARQSCIALCKRHHFQEGLWASRQPMQSVDLCSEKEKMSLAKQGA